MGKYTHLTMLWLAVLVLVRVPCIQAQNATETPSCMPISCPTKCSLACASDHVCTLGTMTDCGVCPTPKCIPKTILKIPTNTPSPSQPASNASDENTNGNKAAMIGGIVGGLVGGALLFAGVAYYVVRKSKKKSKFLPFTFAGNQKSGPHVAEVVPVPLVPVPSRVSSPHTTSAPGEPRPLSPTMSRPGTHALWHAHPAHDRASDSRSSHDETDDDGTLDFHSSRTSVASSVSNQPTSATRPTQVVQVTRLRPQIMRVNQIIVDSEASSSGVHRSGSVRTILTRDNSVRASGSRSSTLPSSHASSTQRSGQSSTDPSTSMQNPFHDRHSVEFGQPPASVQPTHHQTTASQGAAIVRKGQPMGNQVNSNGAHVSGSESPQPPS